MILPILNIIRKLVNNMHKSSIIGFFLVSSLIFGSGNIMILQGAAAQDYYTDDNSIQILLLQDIEMIITTTTITTTITIIHQKILTTLTKNMSVKMVHLKDC